MANDCHDPQFYTHHTSTTAHLFLTTPMQSSRTRDTSSRELGTSSGEEEVSPGPAPAMHRTGSDFKITKEDKSVLMRYTDEFEQADTQMRKNVLEKAMGELYRLRPGTTVFNKKEAKEACTI